MSDMTPAPARVVQLVNNLIRTEKDNLSRYDNREPLDHSATYTLHQLARAIYAAGWTDGYQAAAEQERGNRD